MRTRKVIASTITILGIVLLAFSAITAMTHRSALSSWLSAALGVVIVAIGLALLITEVLETWLSGGQTALVDGLQAG